MNPNDPRAPAERPPVMSTGVAHAATESVARRLLARGRHAVLALALALGATPLPAQTEDVLVIPRLTGPVRLDGFSDEPAWAAVQPLPMTMTRPTFQGAPTERTEVRVAHDGSHLYVAGRLFDSDPSGIQATSLKRDDMDLSNDYFGVVLDTFNDKENALTFFTTPAGIRTDFAVFGDAEDAYPANVSWNATWEVEVARTAEGWFAEFRIPFSSLRFQDRDGTVRMGLIVWRSVARKNEYVIFPAISQRFGFWGMNKPSQAREVLLEGVTRRSPLSLTPYALSGYSRSAQLNAARTGYRQVHHPAREVGLDVKLGLTSNLTLDVTVNTDFAQVEADDQQVNLTRFSLFFPEKRQFFQERAGVFDFRTDDADQLFYSRRIGISPRGEPLRIYGGGRLVGRLGGWDVGVIDMQTEAAEGGGTENLGVVRARRQLLSPGSYVGGMLTSRAGAGGRYNLAYGADALLRLFRHDHLALHWAQTLGDSLPAPGDATLAALRWERRTQDGLGYQLGITRVGPAYDPALGFVRRRDYLRGTGRLGYGWRHGPDAPLAAQWLSAWGERYLRNQDGSTESWRARLAYGLETRKSARFEVIGQLTHEQLDEPFVLSARARVPEGSHRFFSAGGTFQMASGSLLTATATAGGGSFYDGRRVWAGVAPTWNLSSRFEAGANYSYQGVDFPARGERFHAHLARIRGQATLSTRLSATALAQLNSSTNSVGLNLRLRYNPREGNDLYLVYNEGLNTGRDGFDPVRPRSAARTLLLKYSRTFSAR